ncbi:element excision factor XisI family protein [Coleofasciculus chthonoplastes]|uniref:element excision factor XisI family protein n=1 Tax=Coleofasciculus chthonoplastes TaxID=64178 RepID=UPI0032FD93D1
MIALALWSDRYLIVYIGWEDEKQIYGCPIYIDIKDGKIWIERDFTEAGVANELVEPLLYSLLPVPHSLFLVKC